MATATKPPKVESLIETHFCEEAMTPDREKGIIPGVKIVGLLSKNPRDYSPTALKKAIGLYEGAKCNVNHPDGNPTAPRRYQDRLGSVRNVHFREGKGLFADLHFNPKHAIAEQLIWDAEHNPTAVGFSHNAQGKTTPRRGQKPLVEEVFKVLGVDLVADPAGADGLYEHVEGEGSITLTEFIESNPEVEGIDLLSEAVAAYPTVGAAPVAPHNPADPNAGANQLKAALVSALSAIAQTVDESTLKKLIEEAMKSGNPDPDKEVAAQAIKEAVQEEVKTAVSDAVKPLLESNAALQKKLDAREVLEAKGAAVNPQLLEELTACTDKSAMETLVEGWSPAKLGKPKPKVSGLREQVEGDYPEKNPFAKK